MNFFRVLFFALMTMMPVMASANTVTTVTGKGTANVVVVDGLAYEIPIARICGMSQMRAGGVSLAVGHERGYITIAGVATRIKCLAASSGGGGSSYHDAWKDSPLVNDNGTVTMNPGEHKVDSPSTSVTDSGFPGAGSGETAGPPEIKG